MLIHFRFWKQNIICLPAVQDDDIESETQWWIVMYEFQAGTSKAVLLNFRFPFLSMRNFPF